ncbi:MAG: transcriptional regulator GcvA [Rhodovibrionaceae bacterium]|nr:transcriptional regulator GcvA [Rhodovibrionaceae bacterium]
MARKLPPLNALRAFEAAARHLSFTKAAEELNVTQAAVSHQVKTLEEVLDVELFRRLNRQIQLTEAGETLLPAASQAFDSLAVAVSRLPTADRTGELRLSALPSFAAKWLMPRLFRFRELHPDIDILLEASHVLTDFRRSDTDLAIRYGGGNYEGLSIELLMREEHLPVCSPRLLEDARANGPPLEVPEDLARHTLLHDDSPGTFEFPAWDTWLKAAGVEGVDTRHGPRFSDSAMLVQAAVAGYGVALGRRSLCAEELASGQLVAPFDFVLRADAAYYLAALPEKWDSPKVHAFRNWLHAEVERTDRLGEHAPGSRA